MRRATTATMIGSAALFAALLGGCPGGGYVAPDVSDAEVAAIDAVMPHVQAALAFLAVAADASAGLPDPNTVDANDPNAPALDWSDPNWLSDADGGLGGCPQVVLAPEPNAAIALHYGADGCVGWRLGDGAVRGGLTAQIDPNSTIVDLTFDALQIDGRLVEGVATFALQRGAEVGAATLAGSFDLDFGELGQITGVCQAQRAADGRLAVATAFLRLWDVDAVIGDAELAAVVADPRRTGGFAPAGGTLALRAPGGVRVTATFAERTPDDGWIAVMAEGRGPRMHRLAASD